jgi:hypothetical protein
MYNHGNKFFWHKHQQAIPESGLAWADKQMMQDNTHPSKKNINIVVFPLN